MRLLSMLILTACSAAPGTPTPSHVQATDAGPPYESANLDLIPAPLGGAFEPAPGDDHSFFLGAHTSISWSEDFDGHSRRAAGRLERYLEAGTGWDLAAEMGPPADGAVHLAIDPALGHELEELYPGCIGEEGYRIEVGGGRLLLRGASGHGLGHAIATLQQMISPEFARDEASEHFRGTHFSGLRVLVEDAPRFRWRGMHLDVGRYLYDVEDVLGFLDLMALYKFNVFHGHLTEDQGWRIEIEAFPKLTEVGAFRKSTPVRGDRGSDDGVPYGGFYTQDEVRRVVAHATSLGIDVMPEIELPGHSTAAIVAYPELGNPEFTGGLEVGYRWGVHPNTLHPSDYTIDFYETVFDEVLELFPFEFVHIGGDEAPKTQWKNSATTQARMAELGLEDEHALQAWFVGHFDTYLAERGRRLVGWDEIAEGGLAPGATMMVWRGWHRGVEAARLGHDIIMAPTSHTYFDYYQADPSKEPEAIFGFLPLEKVYSFEPVPPELTEDERPRVLGAQAQLWSEYLHEWSKVEYMAMPRMLALAEVVWSPEETKDYEDFRRRMVAQLEHLDAHGVNYRVPEPDFAADLVVYEGEHTLRTPAILGLGEDHSGQSSRAGRDLWFVIDDDGAPLPDDGVGPAPTWDGEARPGPDPGDPRWHGDLRVTDTRRVDVALRRMGPDGPRLGPAASVELVRADLGGAAPGELEPGLWLEAIRSTTGIPPRLPALATMTGMLAADLRAPGGHALSAGWEQVYASTSIGLPGVTLDGPGYADAVRRTHVDDPTPELPKSSVPPRRIEHESVEPLAGMDRVAARFHGWLQVDEPGLYDVTVGSDDGSRVLICGRVLVDNDGQHGHVERSATAQLPAGTWPFEVHWFDAGGAESLELSIEGQGPWRFLRRP